jgi:hypothetical protein
VFFWKDIWEGQLLKHTYTELFSFAKKPNITFQKAASLPILISLFNLPLSTQAHDQFSELQNKVDECRRGQRP